MEDAGAKLLAAFEALQEEVRAMRKEASEDRLARELLAQRRSADAERQASYRKRNVTSRDSNVTRGSLKALQETTKLQDQKIPALRDSNVTSRDTGPTWEAFTTAYEARYRVKPVRNASVNSKMAQFVKRIGVEESPSVAAFYVAHNLAWYVKKQHSVGLLLSECEGLRTQWANGRKVTETEARQVDQTQANVDGWSSHLKVKGAANGVD